MGANVPRGRRTFARFVSRVRFPRFPLDESHSMVYTIHMIKRDSKAHQGNIGMTVAMTYFVAAGHTVSIPLNDCQKYDLIVDDGTIKRVQVKTATQYVDNAWRVELRTSNSTRSGLVARPFDNTKVDILFVVCNDMSMYLIPTKDFEPKSVVRLGEKYKEFVVTV